MLIVSLIFKHFYFDIVNNIYQDIVKLFNGKYLGYRKCNTGYHNLEHTEACLLEIVRLMHGAVLNGNYFSEKEVSLGLISAIMHDTGYIQIAEDEIGTGGKFTLIHIERSINFMKVYLIKRGYAREDVKFCENCLKCTGLNVKIDDIQFVSPENEIIGKMLGTADLLGQMADPRYLERLPILYKEFTEAGITDFADEYDFLQKTPEFWEFTQERFVKELGNVDRFMRDHFRVRWGIDRDVLRETIQRKIDTLKYLLQHHPTDYHRYLKAQEIAVRP